MRQREKELPQMQKPTMAYLKNMGERYVDSNLEKYLEIEGLLHGIEVVKSKFWVSKVLIYRKSCLHAYW